MKYLVIMKCGFRYDRWTHEKSKVLDSTLEEAISYVQEWCDMNKQLFPDVQYEIFCGEVLHSGKVTKS